MSSYIQHGKPLEFDNAPDWLVAHLRYRRTILEQSPNTVMSSFLKLREFFQWAWIFKETGRNPKSEKELRDVDLLPLPFSFALEIKKNDITSYLYFITDTLNNKPTSRSSKLAAIRSFYEYLLDQQEALAIEIEGNPASRIPSPKLPKEDPIYLSEKDSSAFLNAIINSTNENAIRDHAMFLLMISTGMRISEVVKVDMADLNMDAKEIRIKQAKGGKDGTAVLTSHCIDAIQRYLLEYRNTISEIETSALFVSRRLKKRLTVRGVQKAMRNYILEAKLSGKGYTPHKLRHTAGTMLAKDGVGLLEIQSILRHENPATTKIYTHLDKSDISRAVNGSSLASLGKQADYKEIK